MKNSPLLCTHFSQKECAKRRNLQERLYTVSYKSARRGEKQRKHVKDVQRNIKWGRRRNRQKPKKLRAPRKRQTKKSNTRNDKRTEQRLRCDKTKKLSRRHLGPDKIDASRTGWRRRTGDIFVNPLVVNLKIRGQRAKRYAARDGILFQTDCPPYHVVVATHPVISEEVQI